MTPVTIQTYEDRSRPTGGHAVICLLGISDVPRNAAFTLEPVDFAAAGRDLAHWPQGEILPLEVRRGESGVELVVGAGIADNPILIAGTPVRIALPHAGLRGEFLWPSIAPTARPRRRTILAARTVDDATSTAPAPTAHTPSSLPAPKQEPVMAERRADDIARVTQRPNGPTAPQASPSVSPRLRGSAVRTAEAASEPETSEPADGVFYAHARGGKIHDASGGSTGAARGITDLLPQSRTGAAGVAIAALLALQATAYMMMSSRASVNLAALPSSVLAPDSQPGAVSVYDVLSVGEVSPMGVRATAVAPARQLELANASLFAEGAARDTDEAAFWLKRHIAATASDDGFRRTLTQLGSTYAAPSRGTPDYARARQVWEIAAAYGDPVATCFIARLHEAALVANSDPEAAQKWTERARAAGGCSKRDGAATVK